MHFYHLTKFCFKPSKFGGAILDGHFQDIITPTEFTKKLSVTFT